MPLLLLLTPPRPPKFNPPPTNWVPSLTGTLRPTLVSFSPPSSTCIWVLCRSLDLPRDCSRLSCDGGKPTSVPIPPRNGEKMLPPIIERSPIPLIMPSPTPPRFESEGDGVVKLLFMLPSSLYIFWVACTGDAANWLPI